VKAPDESPAGQKVEAPATEFAGARAGEDEPPTVARLEDLVDDAQELRDPLHLVENDGIAIGRAPDEVPQALRPRGEFALQLGTEKVEVESIPKDVLQPRRLSRAARTEEEEALLRRSEKARRYFRNGSQNGNSMSGILDPGRPGVKKRVCFPSSLLASVA
jgi:hypothetical protein